eukprot:366537-Chlamydomonas_euryale.AAC.20
MLPSRPARPVHSRTQPHSLPTDSPTQRAACWSTGRCGTMLRCHHRPTHVKVEAPDAAEHVQDLAAHVQPGLVTRLHGAAVEAFQWQPTASHLRLPVPPAAVSRRYVARS